MRPEPIFLAANDPANAIIQLSQPAQTSAPLQPITLPVNSRVVHREVLSATPKPVLSQQQWQESSLLPARKETPQVIWQRIKDKIGHGEYQLVPLDNFELAKRLRDSPKDIIYEDIEGLLHDNNVAVEEKVLFLDLLAETATPDALGIMLGLTKLGPDSLIYFFALNAIERLSGNRWNEKFHDELSPALESEWNDPSNVDPAVIKTIGSAIAQIGTAKGAETLIKTLSTEKPDNSNSTIKQETALNNIPKITNPAAVDVLGAALISEAAGTPAFEASGSALANIGNVSAAEKLIAGGQIAGPETARNFEEWLSVIDDPKALSTLSTASSIQMQSPEVSATFDVVASNKDSKGESLISNTSN
jgi:hypothetical protein